MNTRVLPRQRVTRTAKRQFVAHAVTERNNPRHLNDLLQYPTKNIEATTHTGEPARSFKMLFQYEEAARYRSQEMIEYAERMRLQKEVRLAQRMRRQTESGARRARRTLASILLG